MPENAKIETDKIQNFSQILVELPDVSAHLTKRKVVAQLESDIRRARDKGYTLREILRHLQSNGFDLSYATLRAALPRQTKSRAGTKEPSGRASDDERVHGGIARLSVVAPSGAHRVASEGPPAPATREGPAATSKGPAATPRAPGEPTPLVFPPGASCIFTGDGQFVPAPDSDDL
jgi:hypothetical protein